MRYVGRVAEWNDDRGFGFVTPNGGGDRAFVHVTAFKRKPSRPVTGLLISYDLVQDSKGRYNASGVRLVAKGSKPTTVANRRLPRKLIGTLFLGVLLLGWLFSRIPTAFVIAYVAMSVLAFMLYGHDKSAARNNRWRTPESTLHFFALLGGWPGALFAQDVFRHKSKKADFQTVFLVTILLNCIALMWLLSSGRAAAIDHAILSILGI